MARNFKKPTRSLTEIFELGDRIGRENVLINYAEIGIVLAGGAEPLDPATVANKRYRGELDFEVIRGANREGLARLSDVLACRAPHRKAG